MKKLIYSMLTAASLFAASCSDSYDDTALSNRVGSLENRIASLEEQCRQMNSNISSIQTIVNASQGNDYITSVSPLTEGGVQVDYTINFAKSESITIYHGKDGKNGQNGTDGKDGKGGENGTNGSDGATGPQGPAGKDGITPQLKIENGNWYVSTDNGQSWTNLGKATGENGAAGGNGADGANGDSLFLSVDTKSSNEYVTFTLADGTEL